MNHFRIFPREGPPLVIAHRGASLIAPENTILAALRGHEAGAFAWELDVQLSRDGVPVVLHDESLLRTTDVAMRFASDRRSVAGFQLSDFDWDEIRTLDAGRWFADPMAPYRSAAWFGSTSKISSENLKEFQSGNVKVPGLEEALRLTLDLDWRVNVELKSFPDPNPRLLPIVLNMIDELAMADRVLISSFDHNDIAEIVRNRPDIATGVLAHTPLHEASRYVRDLVGADFLHVSHESVRTRAGRDALRQIPTFIYTVNDPMHGGLADSLAKAGVAALFSDDPTAIGNLFSSHVRNAQ